MMKMVANPKIQLSTTITVWEFVSILGHHFTSSLVKAFGVRGDLKESDVSGCPDFRNPFLFYFEDTLTFILDGQYRSRSCDLLPVVCPAFKAMAF